MQNDEKNINVLYVNNDEDDLALFESTFKENFNIFTARSDKEAEKVLLETEIEIILTHQDISEKKGIDFLESILEKHPHPIRILVSSSRDFDMMVNAVNRSQIYKFIQQPWEVEHMKTLIINSYKVYCLKKEDLELTKTLLRVNSQVEFMLRQKLKPE